MSSSLPANPDVVVIGAGAAGLAAARALIEQGRSALLLEAADHIGGRCVTDTATLGLPFDRGGSWIHSAAANPLAPLARELGFTIIKDRWWARRVQIAGRDLDAAELANYRSYLGAMWTTLDAAGRDGRDVAASAVLPAGGWRDYAKHGLASMTGHDAEEVSTLDEHRFTRADGEWLLTEGLGTLIERLGTGLPVRLNTPATAIDWSGRRVRVETPAGTVCARAAVVTVSTGVLAAEKITFTPPLPDWKRRAIEDLPMGLLNKVAVRLTPGAVDEPSNGTISYFPRPGEFAFFRFRYCNTDMVNAFIGGRFAAGLEQAGPGAATAFCLEGLRSLFGSAITRRVLATAETAWLGHPLTLGSYSGARPGRAEARAAMRLPVGDRIFFAGEACTANWFATVAGAHLSGFAAAREAAAALAGAPRARRGTGVS